ncbi:exostosin family protein [Bizionia hallyeonensis]|uniref:Exostosin family protein n=1 Tax=Bizionia hallyeonensis TaxID=1123757 RepID=A0ABW0C5J5_9FLAO
MKIHYPEIAYSEVDRSQLFPLLKPFLKSEAFTDDARKRMYAITDKDVSFVSELEQADIAILPMSWNYYTRENIQDVALAYINLATRMHKPVWIVLLGDIGLPIPELKNTIVFRASGYQTKLPIWHQGMPVFIADPLEGFYKAADIKTRPYSPKPRIGFCGLASGNKWVAFKTLLKIGFKNLGHYFKLYAYTPEAFIAAPYFRYQCLKPMMQHSGITDHFIMRTSYRAGARSHKERETSTLEFYNNIQESDYVMCVRGAGNFSTRFYETLAMGRIPIYVHTDGLLPLSDTIDWKKHVVWIERHEISDIAEKVLAFHKDLNDITLNELFTANRNLWLDSLRMGSFFKHYTNEL